ncbi:hypothetical protein K443DRAFT_684471 [Laccaria amethystina LaAM-08-1]|uniref:Arrestin-like N-terminal domain-containing protein n=1 Tax=Laccaria amethystina LaAM-08-1 TaxID=1095629 RepID=A0A0C9X7K3_9AGAR|nr:hypothetical protein K443DRAFT_684471 [Laccaria amethystina LaAM-08-1]
MSSFASPPRYSTTVRVLPINDDDNLPRYSLVFQPRNPPQKVLPTHCLHKHRFHIRNSAAHKNKPWATLTVFSRADVTTRKAPRFFGSDPVAGTIDLDIETPLTVNSITISLRGRVITSFLDGGSYTFIDHRIPIWHRCGSADGKLVGTYSWPFSFPFPQEVSIPGRSKTFPAPQTFLERGTNANVQYDLVLHITHGLPRPDSKLQTGVVYVPDIKPGPSSLLSQQAYRDGRIAPPPHLDPAGWLTLPKVLIRGQLLGHDVGLECLLSLANPQCYTRGTIIPLHIRIHTQDALALDTLASHKMINVKLVRRVHFSQDAAQYAAKLAKIAELIEDVEDVERAVWRAPLDDGPQEGPNVRRYSGEIHLRKELQPSCDFLPFRVSYFVELHSFDPSVFKLSPSYDPAIRHLALHPVRIGTLLADGPAPVPFTKPSLGLTSFRS